MHTLHKLNFGNYYVWSRDVKLYACKCWQLSSLKKLWHSNCSDLRRLPDAIGNLKGLRELDVERTAIREVPTTIVHLHELDILKLSNCKRLRFLPELPENIKVLSAHNCKSLQASPSDFSIFLGNQAIRTEFPVVDWSNCFQLDQKKLSKIVKKVLQNINRWETEWLKKAEIEGWKYPPFLCSEFCHKICYPGSEIPDWFDFRGMGSSGSVPLPRGLLQNNRIGVVVCAIVTFADSEYCKSSEFENRDFALDYRLWCHWEVKAKCGQWRWNSEGCSGAGILPYVDSDHVTLCYTMGYNIFGEDFDESLYNNQVFIRFFSRRNDVNCSKVVKEWGIHFLYRQDFSSDEKKDEIMKDFSSGEEEDANKQLKMWILYRQKLIEFVKDFTSDEEEDANEGDSKSEEKGNDEQEEPHPKRLKSSTSSF